MISFLRLSSCCRRHRRYGRIFPILLATFAAIAQPCLAQDSKAETPPSVPAAETLTDASPAAQRVYAQAREQLVQVRTLVKGSDSQSSVGSGFLIEADANARLLLTNYHVISTALLEPQRHRLVYTTGAGQQGALSIVAFDVVHDLALLRIEGEHFAHTPPLRFRPAHQAMQRGERIFALGNPLDVGFAVMEGHYNGEVERAFYPHIFFGGSLSGGMSGGPALDENGQVIGVNVATRRDGEQISFLVPSQFAQPLLERARAALATSSTPTPLKASQAYAEITRQLLAHQELLTERFIALPWQAQPDAEAPSRYQAPIPQEVFMRCWGDSSRDDETDMRSRESECTMDWGIFVRRNNTLGTLNVSHTWLDGRTIGPWRFAQQYSDLFGSQVADNYRGKDVPRRCHERFVEHNHLPMRAVLCIDGLRKLPGLYTLHLITASVNQDTQGLLSSLQVEGVSYANAMRLTEHFLKGFAWKD